MAWKIEKFVKKFPVLNNPILVEGLPGIGNVGKVAVDFVIAESKTVKICRFFSHGLPNSVFVNEESLIELPTIELYYKKMGKGKRDLLLLAGDIQPTNEESSYEFCETVIGMCRQMKCREIITLGGIGLSTISKTPKVYCTGNSKEIVRKYTDGTGASPKLYGVVGPIVGVSGLLVGLAERQKISGIAMLAETLAHPMYLGIRGAKEIIKVLDRKLKLGVDVKKLERDIKDMESDIMKGGELEKASRKMKSFTKKETSYIG
ncbi:MAG: hypothetical protein QS98_C0011G0070 [archaeon GW2011_AR3]|nr:MAG: hypothetical protein QS98_C0011G0070 [archaeon GW2011_AR3]MBS3109666.1 PAC2 family protein [Candidatus Woesearchaeota archaeon]